MEQRGKVIEMHSEINCLDHHHSTFLSPYPEKMGFDIGRGSIKHGYLLIRDTDIQHTIMKIAATIINQYAGKDNLHFIINVRNGIMFGSDLLQRLSIPVSFDFMTQHGRNNDYNFVSSDSLTGKTCIVVQGPSNEKFYCQPITSDLKSFGAKDVQFCFCTVIPEKLDIPVENLQYVGYLLQNLDDTRYLVGYGAGRRSKNQNVKALYSVEV